MKILIFPVVFFLAGCAAGTGEKADGNDPFHMDAIRKETFSYLLFGENRPQGWILEQMKKDLEGFTGRLDELVPGLVVEDDIYGRDRLTRFVRRKDVGNLPVTGAVEKQYLWWNSETQSNWRDGHIRNAILTGSPGHLARVHQYTEKILSTQDSDGYLGIYDTDMRYRFRDENGELWAKTTLLRGLLACYESGTGDRDRLLYAIERAVGNVMDNYPAGSSSPFRLKNAGGGACHGLVFTDVLDRLHQLTGKKEYLDYALFLYRDYCANTVTEADIQYNHIVDPDYKLYWHGVHTYEHLRPLAVAAFASGNEKLFHALQVYVGRIDKECNPSGGPVGDEWIIGRHADASLTGYEYCSLHELLDSWSLMYQKSGDARFGDRMEQLFFNAALGARHPEEYSIAYLKSDNSYAMMGGLNDTTTGGKQTRYKYSPTHQDIAVCCVPNAGRITPSYVRSMWMRDEEGLVAALYGPCTLNTSINGNNMKITEETGYPYTFTVTLRLELSEPVDMVLKLRKPSWVTDYRINAPACEKDNYIVVQRLWQNGDELVVEFHPRINVHRDINGEYYFTYGPLVLAHPITAQPVEIKKYPLAGFRDLWYKPEGGMVYKYHPSNNIQLSGDGSLLFHATLLNSVTGLTESVELVPMGSTILRQVTFMP